MKEMKIKRLENVIEIDDLEPFKDIVEIRTNNGNNASLSLYAGCEDGNYFFIEQHCEGSEDRIYNMRAINPRIFNGVIYMQDIGEQLIARNEKYDKMRRALSDVGLWREK